VEGPLNDIDAPRDWQRLSVALLQLERYSIQITRFIEDVVGEGAASNHSFLLLMHLFREGPTGPSGLGAAVGVSRASVARLVSDLEAKKIVERVPSPSDGRAVLVRLTPTGRRRVGRVEHGLGMEFGSLAPLAKETIDLLGHGDALHGTPAPEESPLEVAHEMAMAGAQWVRDHGDVFGSQRQRTAAAAIAVWGEARPGQLQELLGLSSGGVTYLVDQMVAGGFVEREYGTVTDDRRAVTIKLTDLGREQVRRVALALEANAVPISRALVATLGSDAVL
jgi:DNA-binding MarR family transcriptional regulator